MLLRIGRDAWRLTKVFSNHRRNTLDPSWRTVDAWDELQVLATGFDEVFLGAVTDFFDCLEAIGDKAWAHNRETLNPFLGEFDNYFIGVGVNPRGATKA